MLTILVEPVEVYNEKDMTISHIGKAVEVRLEHSLVSISKWESSWGKSFLSDTTKSRKEQTDYIRKMLITKNVSDATVEILFDHYVSVINAYIEHPMTATTFYEVPGGKGRRDIITAELIYYWMIAFNVPFECQRWHLNRLLTLIKVCNVKNSKDQKMNKKDTAASNRALNEQRKAKFNTKG